MDTRAAPQHDGSHKVYVTHNTEYHTREGVCIGVRDRRTGQWIRGHAALGHKIAGSIHTPTSEGDLPFRREPAVGDAILFDSGMHHVVTSALERVTRPPGEVVAAYPDAR